MRKRIYASLDCLLNLFTIHEWFLYFFIIQLFHWLDRGAKDRSSIRELLYFELSNIIWKE